MNLECWKEITINDPEIVNQFKKKGQIFVDLVEEADELIRNQGVIINSALLGVYDSKKRIIRKLNTSQVSGMNPGDIKDLQLLYDLLWNPDIKVVIVDAVAGTGKTSTTMAFANHFALNRKTAMFDQLILTRPNSEVGKGHGFLPGTLDEKMAPLLGAYYQWIERFSQSDIEMLKLEGRLVAQPIAFVRGLDIQNSYLIIDEAQNMTKHEMKTMLTRVAENTKVVIIGDSSPNQIDVGGLNSENNGLTHVKNNFYGQFDWFGYVELKECLRGEICKAATQLL